MSEFKLAVPRQYQGSSGLGLQLPSWLDPIGAFYDSQSSAYDNAASIASKTGVLTDVNGNKVSAAQVAALDVNHDGVLNTSESAYLKILTDTNEDGHLNSGELNVITQAIRQQDWMFYTQGNARMVGAGAMAPTGVSVVQPQRVNGSSVFAPVKQLNLLVGNDKLYGEAAANSEFWKEVA
jgi:hypothetical protein